MSFSVKVLTYNIHHCADAAGSVSINSIGETIANSGAHLAALQEVDCMMPRTFFSHQARRLAKKLGMKYVFGANMKWLAIFQYGNAVLSRFPIVAKTIIPLPGKTEKRGILITLIRARETIEFYFLCAHLGLARGERQEQIKKIIEITGTLNRPYILAGDFNTGLDSGELTTLTKYLEGTALKVSGRYATFPSYRPIHGLDYIFTSRHWQVVSCQIITSSASDHLPVMAEVLLDRKKSVEPKRPEAVTTE